MHRRTFLATGVVLGATGCLGPTPDTTGTEPDSPTEPATETGTPTTTATPDRSPEEQYDYWTGELEEALTAIGQASVTRYPFEGSMVRTDTLADVFQQAENMLTRLDEEFPAKFNPKDLQGYILFAKIGQWTTTVLAELDAFTANWQAAEQAMNNRDYATAKEAFSYERLELTDAIEQPLSDAQSMFVEAKLEFTKRKIPADPPEAAELVRRCLGALTYQRDLFRGMSTAFTDLIVVSESYQGYWEDYQQRGELENPVPMQETAHDVSNAYPRSDTRTDEGFEAYTRVTTQLSEFTTHLQNAVYEYYARGKTDEARGAFADAITAYTSGSLDEFFDFAFPEHLYD